MADEHLELELDADLEVMRYLAAGPSSRSTTEQAHRDRLQQARAVPATGLWVGSTDGWFVGCWLLRPRSRAVDDSDMELGYRLLRRFWRRGLAGEASRATMTAVGLTYVRGSRGERDPSRLGAERGDVEYAVTRKRWYGREA